MPLTDPVPSSSFDVLERNIQDTDKFVNQEAGTFTNRVGKEIKPIPVIEAEANAAVISLGWHQVGLFADGFTYLLQNDIAKDSFGDWYRWNGSLPKIVTAGTLPSSDANFVKIDYKSHAELTDRNPADGSAHNADDVAKAGGGSVQDFIDGLAAPDSDVLVGGVAAGQITQQLALKAPQATTYTKTEVDSALAIKASQEYVDGALANLSTLATKFYPTLAAANADIGSLSVNQAVNIGETVNGGLWYKATAGASSLTKSPYDLETKLVNMVGLYLGLSSVSTTNSDQDWVTVNKNKLTFHGIQPYLIHPNGTEVKRFPSWISETYTFAANDVLLWNTDANTLVQQNINTARPANYILLIRYSNFEFDSGALVPFLRKNELNRVSFVVVSTSTGTVEDQRKRITIRGNRVSFNKVTFFAVASDGRLLRSISGSEEITAEYVLPDNSVLFWDFYNKTLSVLGNNDDRPDGGIVLLSYKNGMFQDGYLIPYLHTTGQLSIADSLHATTEGRCFTYSDADTLAHQGLTIENQRLWSFSASAAGNTSSFAEARIFNAETLKKIGSITHNLGHSATNDYCPENDYMMSANGEYSASVLPKIYLIPNWSTKQNGDVVDITNPALNIITIPFVEYEADGTTVKRQLGGSGCIGCFGEQKYIAYIMTGQFDYTMKFFKVLLGTGTNNFSYAANSSKTDAAKTYWGTYTAAAAGEYNGTAKIIGEYTGINYGVAQGLAYHDGKLYFGLTTSLSGMTLSAVEIELMQNGTFRTTKRFAFQDVGANGNAMGWESEGLCIKDGRYLQVGGYHNGAMMWAFFPLYNEQGGKGIVGETITLPFKCNSLPQILITPTSETTDLYVTDVTKTSFKVLSSSNGVGMFNWSCKLS